MSISGSFRLALDDKRIIIGAQALKKALALRNSLSLPEVDDDIKALANEKGKRKRDITLDINKRPKSGAAYVSPVIPESPEPPQDDEDVEWSDCDELELSRNISLLERSITEKSVPKSPEKYNGDRNLHRPSIPNSAGTSTPAETTTSTSVQDDDLEWSDCDEFELSRNISLMEESINISTSKLDRSALQEISNLSKKDKL